MDLRPASYFALAALLEEPLHGYAISARARELSGGDVRLTAGTLYGALERMSGQGLVEIDREETVEGRLRRYYRITGAGREVVVAEADRLAAAARVVQEARPPVARGARLTRRRVTEAVTLRRVTEAVTRRRTADAGGAS